MKLGLGLYRHMLTTDNFRFAKQAGATHIVAHMTDYFNTEPRIPTSESTGSGWGTAGDPDKLWTYEEFRDLREAINAEGLELAALENFDPSHWYDVLLDGPRKQAQMENLKTMIRAMGKAGIPCMGYNFSIAGVWGHVEGPWARGGADSVGFLGPDGPAETSIPQGMVWNMVYDPEAPAGDIGEVTHEQLWQRLSYFLEELVPVAEEAGVRLAAHPDDPPMPTLRNTARLVYQPHYYQKLIDLKPSHHNGLEFCLGSLSEMTEGNIYEVIDQYSQQDKVCYVHCRNVTGKVPKYHEVFIDEGDIDVIRALRILKKNTYQGVIIPDHTPQMTCDAPWHAGMAYALGWLKAVMMMLERE